MQVLAIAGTILTVTAIFAGAFVVMRSTLSTTTASLWEKNAEALEARVGVLEQDEAACKAKLEALEISNKVLSEQVTGASAIAQLSAKIDNHHADVMGLIGGKRQSDTN
jgi:hypothetical protein